ncbi:AAA family ATPase [candidate division KSB1 bacterium 4484_188]|nr:MAG: AAA family ATPase [candidate division KSB1 bacterium 4484_188]
MILKETLRDIIRLQVDELKKMPIGIPRTQLATIDLDSSFIIILSGIRRCGKSTLLRQLMNKTKCFYYFNFEDPRAINFEVTDFNKLEQVFHEELGECPYYFFDEIQNVPEWERFVRRLHDAGKQVFITGSNASLLSRELGNRLTGRHLSYEIFPFSFHEMLSLTKKKHSADSLQNYLELGGFPEYLKSGNIQILHQLFRDIIVRDIVTRYQIRDYRVLMEMAIYLMTNTGNEFSYNRLKNQFGLGSVNTVISYLSYLEDSYLFFTVPKFSFSYAKQRAFSKKIYTVDPGLIGANTASLTPDLGRLLENAVFLHLKKQVNDIFYYRNNSECDFLVKEKGKIKRVIQVCYQLNDDNVKREIKGIKDAIKTTGATEGVIVTLNQKDEIEGIPVLPAWEFIE